MAGTRIPREITLHRCIPAVLFFSLGEERQLRRTPVARHEAFKIVPIPGFLLHAQQAFDGSRIVAVEASFVLHTGLTARRDEQDRQKAGEEQEIEETAAHVNLRIPAKPAHQFRITSRAKHRLRKESWVLVERKRKRIPRRLRSSE